MVTACRSLLLVCCLLGCQAVEDPLTWLQGQRYTGDDAAEVFATIAASDDEQIEELLRRSTLVLTLHWVHPRLLREVGPEWVRRDWGWLGRTIDERLTLAEGWLGMLQDLPADRLNQIDPAPLLQWYGVLSSSLLTGRPYLPDAFVGIRMPHNHHDLAVMERRNQLRKQWVGVLARWPAYRMRAWCLRVLEQPDDPGLVAELQEAVAHAQPDPTWRLPLSPVEGSMLRETVPALPACDDVDLVLQVLRQHDRLDVIDELPPAWRDHPWLQGVAISPTAAVDDLVAVIVELQEQGGIDAVGLLRLARLVAWRAAEDPAPWQPLVAALEEIALGLRLTDADWQAVVAPVLRSQAEDGRIDRWLEDFDRRLLERAGPEQRSRWLVSAVGFTDLVADVMGIAARAELVGRDGNDVYYRVHAQMVVDMLDGSAAEREHFWRLLAASPLARPGADFDIVPIGRWGMFGHVASKLRDVSGANLAWLRQRIASLPPGVGPILLQNLPPRDQGDYAQLINRLVDSTADLPDGDRQRIRDSLRPYCAYALRSGQVIPPGLHSGGRQLFDAWFKNLDPALSDRALAFLDEDGPFDPESVGELITGVAQADQELALRLLRHCWQRSRGDSGTGSARPAQQVAWELWDRQLPGTLGTVLRALQDHEQEWLLITRPAIYTDRRWRRRMRGIKRDEVFGMVADLHGELPRELPMGAVAPLADVFHAILRRVPRNHGAALDRWRERMQTAIDGRAADAALAIPWVLALDRLRLEQSEDPAEIATLSAAMRDRYAVILRRSATPGQRLAAAIALVDREEDLLQQTGAPVVLLDPAWLPDLLDDLLRVAATGQAWHSPLGDPLWERLLDHVREQGDLATTAAVIRQLADMPMAHLNPGARSYRVRDVGLSPGDNDGHRLRHALLRLAAGQAPETLPELLTASGAILARSSGSYATLLRHGHDELAIATFREYWPRIDREAFDTAFDDTLARAIADAAERIAEPDLRLLFRAMLVGSPTDPRPDARAWEDRDRDAPPPTDPQRSERLAPLAETFLRTSFSDQRIQDHCLWFLMGSAAIQDRLAEAIHACALRHGYPGIHANIDAPWRRRMIYWCIDDSLQRWASRGDGPRLAAVLGSLHHDLRTSRGDPLSSDQRQHLQRLRDHMNRLATIEGLDDDQIADLVRHVRPFATDQRTAHRRGFGGYCWPWVVPYGILGTGAADTGRWLDGLTAKQREILLSESATAGVFERMLDSSEPATRERAGRAVTDWAGDEILCRHVDVSVDLWDRCLTAGVIEESRYLAEMERQVAAGRPSALAWQARQLTEAGEHRAALAAWDRALAKAGRKQRKGWDKERRGVQRAMQKAEDDKRREAEKLQEAEAERQRQAEKLQEAEAERQREAERKRQAAKEREREARRKQETEPPVVSEPAGTGADGF